MTEETTPEVVSPVLDGEIASTKRKRGRPKGSKTRTGLGRGHNKDPRVIGGPAPGQHDRHLSPILTKERDFLMLAQHITGTKIKEIAETYNVSNSTVHTAIDRAKRTELFQSAKDYISLFLVPKALKVLETAIEAGNVEVSLAIARGTGLLSERAASPLLEDAAAGGTNDFDEWRMTLVRRRERSELPEETK